MRRVAKTVKVGGLCLGGSAPVLVQSMLNALAGNVQENVRQAVLLKEAGCQIIRLSVPSLKDVALISAIKSSVDVPLVADIHFDWRIAIEAVAAGVDKIRINPGNIGGAEKVRAVANACKSRGVPIRVGVNGGSLEKELLKKHGGISPAALCESALNHIKMLEQEDFGDIVVSIKASNVPVTVNAYRLLAKQCPYPLHLGVTEAGTYRTGLVKNAMGIGALLLDGIGDTLRVSLTAPPEKEVQAGFDILRAAGLLHSGVELISCPTCGRTNINVEEIANQVEKRLAHCKKPIKVAIMGCVVNGLGEGKDADIGIAGGKDDAILFIKGKKVRVLCGNFVEELLLEVEKLAGETPS